MTGSLYQVSRMFLMFTFFIHHQRAEYCYLSLVYTLATHLSILDYLRIFNHCGEEETRTPCGSVLQTVRLTLSITPFFKLTTKDSNLTPASTLGSTTTLLPSAVRHTPQLFISFEPDSHRVIIPMICSGYRIRTCDSKLMRLVR